MAFPDQIGLAGGSQQESELRRIVNLVPQMLAVIEPDGRISWMNEVALKYLGITLEDLSADDLQTRVFHPDDLQSFAEDRRKALAENMPLETERRMRAKGGEYRWFSVRAMPLRDEHGNILKWYGISTDINDHKRAEALLTGEKRILEMVAKGDSLAHILDGLCRLVEEQGAGVLASILLLDGNRLRHGGAPNLPAAYVGAIDGGMIGPVAGSCGTAAYRRQQVIVEDIATDPLWADYRELALPYSLRACWSTPVFSSQGNVMATFAMYYREPRSPNPRDREIIEQITHLAGVAIERKQTQEALRRSEAYLAEAQRLTKTGSWATDASRLAALYCSDELLRIFELDPTDRLPSYETLLQRIHPQDRERVREASARMRRERSNYDDEYRLLLPDGSVKYVHVVGRPVFNDSGEVVEFVGTTVDVTEHKRAEQERERLRQLEADLARISRVSTMGELTASLAHEIKQPIAAAATNAKTSLRWLQHEPPEIGKAREAVSRIVKDAYRASDIIDRTRSLFRRDAPKPEVVHLNDLVRELIELLHDTASQHSISVRTEFDDALPAITADRVQLQQVLMNLMRNGIEAMKDTGGELTIRSKRTEDCQVLLSVSDLGVGLPIENAEHIFDAFFTTKAHGTGMGLSISRRIIESHGGRMWANANGSRGATFSFTLPVETAAADLLKTQAPEA